MNQEHRSRLITFPLFVSTLGLLALMAGCPVGDLTLPAINQDPTANAGADRTIGVGQRVTLDALGSTDADDDALTFLWEQRSGPTVELDDAHTGQPSFVAVEDGFYEFALTVTDGRGGSDTSIVHVFVGDVDPATCPRADAGTDQTVSEGVAVRLHGGNSGDPGGGPLAFDWFEISGPQVSINGVFIAEPSFAAPQAAAADIELEFELTVTNERGCTDRDTVVITVRDRDPGDPCNGVVCDDDDSFCNGVEICDDGECRSSGDPCSANDTCDEQSATCTPPTECASDAGCDDDLFCNGEETCVEGRCETGAVPCPTDRTCSEAEDSCAAAPGCTNDTDCEDGEACNATTGECVPSCTTDADCDDGLFCNGPETCSGEICAAGTDPCPSAECDEVTERCADAAPVESTFEAGDEGWRLDGGAFGGPTAPVWSSFEEYVYVDSAMFAYWIAPEKFHGDFSGSFGRALEFESAWKASCCAPGDNQARVVLAGAGITLLHSPAYDPGDSGWSYWIRLDETESWFDSATGLRATADQIQRVLSDVTQIKILAGARGFSWIDNVVFGSVPESPRLEPAESTFDEDDEGWRLGGGAFGLITTPSHDVQNGFVSALNASFARWRSPSSFRGNFSDFFGATLIVDESWENRCCGPGDNSARIVAAGGGFLMWTSFGTDPVSTLGSFSVRLDESQGWSISGGNDQATRDQILAVLTNLQAISILTGAGGESRLDRVIFGAN